MTDAEVRRPPPGDDPVPWRGDETTRAITVDASTEAVWPRPRLVRLGQGTGGSYSDAALETPVGADATCPSPSGPTRSGGTRGGGDTIRSYPPDTLVDRVPGLWGTRR